MSTSGPADDAGDAYDPARPLVARGLLGAFADAGILHAADVHVAQLLGRLAAPSRPGGAGPATSGRDVTGADGPAMPGEAVPGDAAHADDLAGDALAAVAGEALHSDDLAGDALAAVAADVLHSDDLAGDAVAADALACDTALPDAWAGAVDVDAWAAGGGHRRVGEHVLLAAALAVRALRLGSVCVDLEGVGRLASPEGGDGETAPSGPVGPEPLPGAPAEPDWPEPAPWLAAVAASPLVDTAGGARSGTSGPRRPLRLEGSLLYLDRYWHDEQLVAQDIASRTRRVEALDETVLAGGLARLFPGEGGGEAIGPDLQRAAAATAALGRFTVVSGGPGTGKTTTVARLLVLVHEQSLASGAPPPLVALAAPTGKAAARLEQAVRQEAAGGLGGPEMSPATREWMGTLRGSTLHRLLGRLPATETRFRHDARNHLPHDLVVVDEASMVALSLMARLLEAVRPDARVVLVGDHEQLASVEAGSVLGDIVGPAASGDRMSPSRHAELDRMLGEVRADAAPRRAPGARASGSQHPRIGDCVVVLRRVHRFGGAIAELATAIQRGDPDAALEVLAREAPEVAWRAVDARDAPLEQLGEVRELAVRAGTELSTSARRGDAAGALEALGRFRLLCANRRGPYGVATWQQIVESWIAGGVAGFATGEVWAAGAHFYPGLPLLVTANDYDLRLYNGDAGVVIESGEHRLAAVFESAGPSVRYGLDRLGEVERCFASTVHKSQGSQFDAVAVVLPDPSSPILTRELLYTAVTRARQRVVVVGSADAVRAAIERPIARASGLRRRLWQE